LAPRGASRGLINEFANRKQQSLTKTVLSTTMCGLTFMDLRFIDFMESAMAHNVPLPDILSCATHTHGIFNAGTSIIKRDDGDCVSNTQLLLWLWCHSHASQSVHPSTI
jgi:hypothetical protein